LLNIKNGCFGQIHFPVGCVYAGVKIFDLLTRFNGTGIGHEAFLWSRFKSKKPAHNSIAWEKSMTEPNRETVLIHANVELTPKALDAMVQTAKQIAGQNKKGHWQVDTADVVSHMISRFLLEKDFESFTQNQDNYRF
jgi:hypothetical protein